MIGKDSYSGIPAWFLKDGNSSTSGKWVTESFLDSRGYVTHEYGRRLMLLGENHTKTSVGICPEFEMNQAYYNNIFTGGVLKLRQVTSNEFSLGGEQNHIFVNTSGKYTLTNSTPFIKAKVTSVPDSGLVRDGNNIFRNVAGSANENTFQYLVGKTTKPRKKNFDVIETNITFTNGLPNIPNYIQEHKVKIARGLYSPYLGIYNTNLLKPNSLVNIYIPGYDTGDMQEYFKIRINCEDSYYPVSPRTSLDEFPENGEHVYRGDCFISQFTHRINRNFLDPDAPCNDTIVEEDTWREKYDEDTDSTEDINRGDLNAVRIGTYLTMKCYSSINLAMRDWDGSFPSEEALTGNKRSFYPLSSFRVDGHGKIPESVMFNLGFNATTGERMNFLQPPVPYIKNIFQTRVIYSDIAQTDAFKNGFRVFKGISYVDYSNQYGGITKLVEWRGNLIIVFEHGVALAAVNEKALIPTDDGTLIAVGAIKPLATTPVMISTDFGSQWPESICKSDNYIYGVDTVGKKIWRTDGTKLECISDFKVLKFLNENITLSEKELTPVIGVRNVKTHYNAFKHDVMFTYYDNTYGFEEKVWNLCWNELQQAFVTFYSWIPSYSANIDNIYFTYDRNSSKWITKLSQSTYGNENASGVCMESPLIEDDSFQEELHLANRPLPDGELNRDYYLAFELIRDNFGFWKYFDIVQTKVSGNVTKSELKIKTGKYNDLLKHWFLIAGLVKDPIIPCVQLNIRCNLSVVTANSDPNGWSQYQVSNAGYYESQVFLTLKDIYENTSRVRNEDGRWVSETLNTVDVYTDDAPTPDPPTPELPYIELEYIESNGTQYINTNVKVKSTQTINTKVKGLGNYSSSGSAHVYFGGRNHNTANVPYFELMSTHNNRVRCSRNNSSDDFYNINWGTELDVIISPTQIKINDDIRSVTTPSGSLNQDIVLCTIQMSGNSLDATPYCSERIYYFKIYDNNDCILNLIPVKRRSDNVVCMYDIQSGEFFTNAGTGNFIAGPEVQQEVTSSSNSNTRSSNWTPDWRNSGGYIESSGTQYIDSGVSSLGFRIECKLNVIGSNLRTLIGSYDTNKCNFVRIDGSNKICVAIGSTDIIIRENFQQNTDCIIDVSNISGSIFYKLNGNTIASSQNTYSDGSYYNGNIFIGANNISNNSAEHLFQGKIYYLKLYNKTGTLVREMYPAIVNNVPCMYDYVTDTYFYNQGTGNFTVSQEVIDASIEPTPSGSITVQLPTFETKFWKHGFAGLIDAQDKIRPCFWYGKQHPFEFEYVVGNDNAGYKQFDNLQISSNNVAPESIHYTIIGDSYDFSLQKSAMYFRQEATKALYQYNGSDLLYDHAVFDPITGYLPQMITSSDYIERDRSGNPLRGNAAVSTSYKDTLFPIIYMRLDTFNEVEDFYKRIIASLPYSDYPNITGGEILWDLTLDLFSICNHVKCRDIKEVGRSRGNIQYVNDKWNIQISPLIVLNRNNTWLKKNNTWLPKLVLANVPKEVYDYTQGQLTDNDFPPEISNIGYDTTLLDGTSWDSIANKRTEVKLLDKVLKTKIRYKGDKLVIVLATATSFNTIA